MPVRALLILFLAAACLAVALPAAAQVYDPLAQAISLFDSSRYDESRALLDSWLKDHPRDARAASYRGRVALAQRDLDAAIKWSEKAADLAPNIAEYHLWLGRAYGLKAQSVGKIRQAFLAPKIKGEFERAVELDPQLIPARMALIDYYLMAPAIVGGSRERAVAQAEKIRYQDMLQGHAAFIKIYEYHKEYDKAKREYQAAIEEHPDSLNLQYQLGYFYQRIEDYNAAFSFFEEMHTKYPEALNPLYQIGRTGALSGLKPERSEECLLLYLRSTPGPTDPPLDAAHFRLGQVYDKSGRKDLAVQEYEAALQLNPKNELAQEAMKKAK